MNRQIHFMVAFSTILLLLSFEGMAESYGVWSSAKTELMPTTLTPPNRTQQNPQDGDFKYVSLAPIYFDSGRATLTRKSEQSLAQVIGYIHKHNSIKRLLIEDPVGSISDNDHLADRRAEVIRNYFAAQGVNPDLLNTVAKNERQPGGQNEIHKGRTLNRHVNIYAIHN